jgi:hypothetical protein
MGIENLKPNPNNEEDGFDTSKRHFLKKSLVVVGGTIATSYGLDRAFNLFLNERRKSKDRPETDREISVKPELMEAKQLLDEVLRTYYNPEVSRRFDPEVFTKDFVMAQQYQESRYNEKAESEAGAKGVYQNLPVSIMDTIKYLAYLRKATKSKEDKDRCDYRGPESISEGLAVKMGELLKQKSDYGRAVGKLYLLAIHDKDYAFNQPPNPDVFRGRSPEKQQELLLLSYHDGPPIRHRPNEASRRGREYVLYVRKLEEDIKIIRRRLEKNGLSRDLDYAIIKIMREMEKWNKNDQDKTIDHWIGKLRLAQDKKRSPIDNKDVWRVFD